MTGPITRRRFGGMLAAGAAVVAGCLVDDGDGPAEATETVDPGLRIDGRALSDAHPIELVRPDVEIEGRQATGDEFVVNVHWHGDRESSHWHRAPVEVRRGESRTLRVRFVDDDLEELPLGSDEEYQADLSLTEDSPDGFLGFDLDGDLVTFHGESPDEGEVVFELLQDGEPRWEAPPLPVEVVAPDADGALGR